MTAINIHEAKTQLSKLVDQAAKGTPFVIAKAGKPLVRVTAISTPAKAKRIGFLSGEIKVPDDFDTMGKKAIAKLFGTGG
jgi:prevent-host-death family protein